MHNSAINEKLGDKLYKTFDALCKLSNEIAINSGFFIYPNSNESDASNENSYKSEGDAAFEKISSIELHESQHVYGLMIEETDNFIANDIVVHNTYVQNQLVLCKWTNTK